MAGGGTLCTNASKNVHKRRGFQRGWESTVAHPERHAAYCPSTAHARRLRQSLRPISPIKGQNHHRLAAQQYQVARSGRASQPDEPHTLSHPLETRADDGAFSELLAAER